MILSWVRHHLKPFSGSSFIFLIIRLHFLYISDLLAGEYKHSGLHETGVSLWKTLESIKLQVFVSFYMKHVQHIY